MYLLFNCHRLKCSVASKCYTSIKGHIVPGFADFELSDPPDMKYNVDKPNFPTKNLRFVGLMALIDPPRETVPDAVSR